MRVSLRSSGTSPSVADDDRRNRGVFSTDVPLEARSDVLEDARGRPVRRAGRTGAYVPPAGRAFASRITARIIRAFLS